MRTYIDTSAFIALHEPRDRHHKEAVAAVRELGRLVTGRHTLVEYIDGLEHRRGQQAAEALERLLETPRLLVVPSDGWEVATRILRGRPDWDVDLSDCLSFALMRAHGLRQAFTFDRDFAKAGFQIVPAT